MKKKIGASNISLASLAKWVFVLVCFGFSPLLFAQPGTGVVVTGKITNERGEPSQGVSVNVKGTRTGVTTNANGQYRITVPNEKSILVFSSVGFAEQSLTVGSNHVHDIVLKDAAANLTDVVVVGYAKQKAVTVTGSVSSVSSRDLVSTSMANVSNMLIGNASGVSGLQASGEPGRNGATLFIRGLSTFAGGNSAQPLVVIDNVEQAPERAYDQLNSMDANEIDNVSVLKDASATAVYGIRGANGVIIVTTRRGRANRPTFSLSSNFGLTKATRLLHNVNSYQYALMRNEAIRTESSSFGNGGFNNNLFSATDLARLQIGRDYTPAEVDAMTNLTAAQKEQLKNSPALYYGSRDLFADEFGGTGAQKQLNLNVTGGTQKVKYFVSLGYFSQGSIIKKVDYYGAQVSSTFNRYNFRSNFDIDVVKNLQISVNLAGQFGETAGPGLTGGGAFDLDGRYKAIMQYIFDSNPLTAPGLVDGKLVNGYYGLGGSPSNPLAIVLGSLKGNQNAIYNLLISGNETLYNTFLSNSVVIRHNMGYLVKGLTLRGTLNLDDNYIKTTTYQPSLPSYQVRRSPVNPNNLEFVGGAIGASGFSADPGRNSTWYKTYFDAGLDYANKFGNHSVTGLILGKGSKYYVPTTNNFNTPSAVVGLLGRIAYNYKEKYLLEANAGYNGTEQFLEGKRFGWFPAYSAGWVASNETFFPVTKLLTFFKVRASYGEVGNDQLGANSRRYLYLPSTFNIGQPGYYFGPSNGSVPNPLFSGAAEGNLGNPNVTWERAKKKNIGLDLRLLSNKLSYTVDYFKDDRDGILTQLDQIIPFAYGVPAASVPPQNVGKVTNHGYEMTLGWNDRIGKVTYYASVNMNYARNKIIYRAESPKDYPWMLQAGYSIDQFKGYRTNGFFNTQEELNNRPYNTENANKATLGDVRYVDINGDGLIDVKDRVPIGFSNLPQYSYGIRGGFNYGGFDLTMLFTGTAKGSFNLAQYQFVNSPFFQTAGNIMDWQFDGRWTADKVAKGATADIKFPRATINGGAGGGANFLTSDLWLIRSDYFRLKNIEVGYRFQNVSWLKKAGISGVRLYANANNIWTISSDMLKYGIDPEAANRSGYAIYPNTFAAVAGINVQF